MEGPSGGEGGGSQGEAGFHREVGPRVVLAGAEGELSEEGDLSGAEVVLGITRQHTTRRLYISLNLYDCSV